MDARAVFCLKRQSPAGARRPTCTAKAGASSCVEKKRACLPAEAVLRAIPGHGSAGRLHATQRSEHAVVLYPRFTYALSCSLCVCTCVCVCVYGVYTACGAGRRRLQRERRCASLGKGT